MARISLADAEKREQERSNYGGGTFINALWLKDKENAYILTALKDVTDVEVHSVHKVQVIGKSGKTFTVDVDCLGKGCSLCTEALKHKDEKFPVVTKARDMVYVPIVRLYDRDGEFSPQFYILSRSTKWYRNTYVEAASRFDMSKPLEIMRSGSGVNTTWSIYPATKAFGKPIPDCNIDQLIEDLDIDLETAVSGTPTSLVRE